MSACTHRFPLECLAFHFRSQDGLKSDALKKTRTGEGTPGMDVMMDNAVVVIVVQA